MNGKIPERLITKLKLLMKSIRPEYYIGYYIFGYALLTLPSFNPPDLTKVLFVFCILSVAGAYAMMLNIYGDRFTDVLIPGKKYMAITVYIWTPKIVLVFAGIFASLLVLLHILGFVLNLLIDPQMSTIALVLGLFLAYTYSVEPLRTKEKPFWDIVTLFLLIFVVQTLYVFAVVTQIGLREILLTLTLATLWLGSTVISSQLEDVPWDKMAGVHTFSSSNSVYVPIVSMVWFTVLGGSASYLLMYTMYNNPYLLLIGLVVLPVLLEVVFTLKFLFSKNYSSFKFLSPIEWFVTNTFILLSNLISR
jgi:4-hydroxybenzoate polyprenyltransferase